MRILLLATDVYGGHGGIALYNRDLCAALASHPDVEEIVVVPRVIHREIEPVPNRVTFVHSAARGRLRYAAAVTALLARKKTFDLVICGHIHLLPVARALSRQVVLMIYGIEAWKPVARSARYIRHVRMVVSISEVTRRRFLAWSKYKGGTALLPNAIHLETYGWVPKRSDLVERYGLQGKKVMLTLGRVASRERYKGFDEVLEVLPAVLETYKDTVYIIAGSGDDMARLQLKAEQLGVFNHVRFTGFVPEHEKRDIYALADVFVMPSRGEGFGFVLLEAMATGIPVIASKHDGGAEAVRNGSLGDLVDPTSSAEIRVAILNALASRPAQIPAGLEYFSFPNFERRLHAIVDELRVCG